MDNSVKSEVGHKGKLILLVEDEVMIAKIHKIFLERMSLNVDTATNGKEAIKKFLINQYALVVLDGGLPDMQGDGLGKLLREIEKGESRERVPFILLSAYSEEILKQWCIDADIDAYGVKPIHPILFENLVMQQLNSGLKK